MSAPATPAASVPASESAPAAVPVPASDPAPPAAAVVTAQSQLTADIDAALSATSWPELNPSIDALGRKALVPEWMQDGCLGIDIARESDPELNTRHCTYGDPNGGKTAVLLGDSVAISYLPAIRIALSQGWRIDVLTIAQCPVAEVSINLFSGSPNTACDDFRR